MLLYSLLPRLLSRNCCMASFKVINSALSLSDASIAFLRSPSSTFLATVLLPVPVDPKCFLPCSWNEKYQFGLLACFKMLMFSPNLTMPLDVASYLFMGVASMRFQFGKATLDSPLARYLGS